MANHFVEPKNSQDALSSLVELHVPTACNIGHGDDGALALPTQRVAHGRHARPREKGPRRRCEFVGYKRAGGVSPPVRHQPRVTPYCGTPVATPRLGRARALDPIKFNGGWMTRTDSSVLPSLRDAASARYNRMYRTFRCFGRPKNSPGRREKLPVRWRPVHHLTLPPFLTPTRLFHSSNLHPISLLPPFSHHREPLRFATRLCVGLRTVRSW